MKEKSAFITIIGRPNVGKSSLMNCVLGQKVAIVSNKPQTTRTKIMGVYTKEETQLVFIDTPGFHKPRNQLDRNMNKAVGDGMADVDVAVLVVEAVTRFKMDDNALPPAELELIKELKRRKLKAILVINKIDLLEKKEELLNMIIRYNEQFEFETVIPLSARTGDGVNLLLKELNRFTKVAPHYFDDDDVTDQPDKVFVAELIREKLLRTLEREVPHGIAIDLERFVERDTNSGEPIVEIEATIICEKDSHKGIIIGKGGETLKKVGSMARRDIEEFFGIKANLKLWVKVKEDWRNRQGLIHTYGLD
ncbi:MAG: GTPase Era [Clostridia bacterium]|nr:GTPase Era [Clostridia bacterium]MBR4973836.1 GTPase Era [Clostridia bacterium]